jgi:hypothetical protein
MRSNSALLNFEQLQWPQLRRWRMGIARQLGVDRIGGVRWRAPHGTATEITSIANQTICTGECRVAIQRSRTCEISQRCAGLEGRSDVKGALLKKREQTVGERRGWQLVKLRCLTPLILLNLRVTRRHF